MGCTCPIAGFRPPDMFIPEGLSDPEVWGSRFRVKLVGAFTSSIQSLYKVEIEK